MGAEVLTSASDVCSIVVSCRSKTHLRRLLSFAPQASPLPLSFGWPQAASTKLSKGAFCKEGQISTKHLFEPAPLGLRLVLSQAVVGDDSSERLGGANEGVLSRDDNVSAGGSTSGQLLDCVLVKSSQLCLPSILL